MATDNPNCDGGRCRSATGTVKLYPLGGGANLILCRHCWDYENAYNAQRGRETGAPDRWPNHDWNAATEYPELEYPTQEAQLIAARKLSDDDVRRHASIATDNGPFDSSETSFTTACEIVRRERGLPHLHAGAGDDRGIA